MKKLIIIGFSGNFYDIAEEIIDQKKYKIIGYIDSKNRRVKDFNYLGNDKIAIKKFNREKKLISIAGLGSKVLSKQRLFNIYKTNMINLIYKKSFISKYAILKKNSGIIIMNNTVLKSFSKINSGVFINSNCVVGHHTNIGKNSTISMGVLIGGNSIIGENCFVGMGTKIFQNVKIGKNVIIGSNLLIKKDIPDNYKIS